MGLAALLIAQVVSKNLRGAVETLQDLLNNTSPELSNFAETANIAADELEKLKSKIGTGVTPVAKIGNDAGEAAEKIDALAMGFAKFGAGFAKVTNESTNKFEDLELLGEKVAKTLETGLTDAFMNIGNGLEGLKDLFGDILQMIARELIRVNVALPLAGAINDLFKADGGPVRAGGSYIVGERGPELFTPSASGHIIPNDKLGGGGGIVVNQSINLTTGVVPTVRAEVQKMMPQIAEVTKGAVAEAAMRGGSYRRALQGG